MREILEGTAMELMVFEHSGSDEQCNIEEVARVEEGREGSPVVTSESVVQENIGQDLPELDKGVLVDSEDARPEEVIEDTFEGSSTSSPTITKQSNENSTTAIGISVHPIPLCN